jgi:hypothetical protein
MKSTSNEKDKTQTTNIVTTEFNQCVSDIDMFDRIVILKALKPFGKYDGTSYLTEVVNKSDTTISYSNLRNLFNHFQPELVDNEIEVQRPVFDFMYNLPPDYETSYEILDEKAIVQYKQRLVRIINEIAERQSYNDIAPIDDLIAEKEFILAELRKAINRFGRSRCLSSQKLKDRQTVVKSIKLIVNKLRELDPELGRICDRHLCLRNGVCWFSAPIRE